jgi:hypothetical protein
LSEVKGVAVTRKCWSGLLAAGVFGISVAAPAATPGFETIYFNDFESGVGAGWTASSGNVFGAALPLGTPPAPAPAYAGQFLGELGGNDSLTLSIALGPAYAGMPIKVYLAFDAYFIRSWDGNDSSVVNGVPLGPDRFVVTVAGLAAPLVDATFSIGAAEQSYCPFSPTPTCGATWGAAAKPSPPPDEQVALGYRYQISPDGVTPTDIPMDMVYAFGQPASPGLLFDFAGTVLTFTFASANLQVRPDLAGTLGVLADESWGLDNVRIEVMLVPEPGTFAMIGAGLLVVFVIARRRSRIRA